jgi:cytoskeletal protein CcmA (bactofilin family)
MIEGSAEGDIHCSGITNMTEKGTLSGALNTNRFIMSEDALFNGSLKIEKEKIPSSPPLKSEQEK